MTSLKIWLFIISIMCFVTHEIHVSAAVRKKQALSSSSKSAKQRIFSLISDFKYEDMWTMFTELNSRRECCDIMISDIVPHVIDDMIKFCTRTTNDEKQQMESFKKHLYFLTSDRFSKDEHVQSIGLLKGRLHSIDLHHTPGAVKNEFLHIIAKYQLNQKYK
eukprot:584968_1